MRVPLLGKNVAFHTVIQHSNHFLFGKTAECLERLNARFLLAALVVVALATIAEPAHGNPSIRVEKPPSVVGPGDRVEIDAITTELRRCALTLRDREILQSVVRLDGRATLRWSWTVPDDAARATWTGSVACWRDAAPDAGAGPDIQAPPAFTIQVRGRRQDSGSIVDRHGIAVGIVPEQPSSADEEPKWTEKGQFWITLVGGILTLVGLVVVYSQLRTANAGLEATRMQAETAATQLTLSREQALADRTATLVERYQRQDYLELWARVGRGYLWAPGPEEQFRRIRLWERAPHGGTLLQLSAADDLPAATLRDVQYLVNFHEEIAVLFNAERVDQDQLVRHFASAIVGTFNVSWWWIHWRRANRPSAATAGKPTPAETEFYAEWQRMADAIGKIRPDVLPRPPAPQQVSILCLPPTHASFAEWGRYQDLSMRLSRPLEAIDALEKALSARLDAPVPPGPAKRVICIPRWDDRAQQERLQLLACGLASVLTDGGHDALEELADE